MEQGLLRIDSQHGVEQHPQQKLDKLDLVNADVAKADVDDYDNDIEKPNHHVNRRSVGDQDVPVIRKDGAGL
jgi:hypothetical protein